MAYCRGALHVTFIIIVCIAYRPMTKTKRMSSVFNSHHIGMHLHYWDSSSFAHYYNLGPHKRACGMPGQNGLFECYILNPPGEK